MAISAIEALKGSVSSVLKYDTGEAERIRALEDETDYYEDILGTYLVQLASRHLAEEESIIATEYMKLIGDYERIADHAVNILESAEEIVQKETTFSKQATEEYKTLCAAVIEILELSYQAFTKNDYVLARKTEPLEQVIDDLKEELRTRHILRLQKSECLFEDGFVWSDLLTNLERVSDHCSNISGYVLDVLEHNMNIHENQRILRNTDEEFNEEYAMYQHKYSV
jgi:phosphate:Na+ symporter